MIYSVTETMVSCDDCNRKWRIPNMPKIHAITYLRNEGWSCSTRNAKYTICPECRKKRVKA